MNQYEIEIIEEEKLNVYANLGKAYVKTIQNIADPQIQQTNDSLFRTLNCMKLEDGYSLGLRLATHQGMGDESWFFVYESEKGPQEYLNKMHSLTAKFEKRVSFDHILVQRTEMGAWQAHLYSIATTLLPVFWHGGYICRRYIFTHDDLKHLYLLAEMQFEDTILCGINAKVSPEIELQGNVALIRCCYWNEWRGLVRETVKMVFEENTIAIDKCELVGEEVLFEYDCGICF